MAEEKDMHLPPPVRAKNQLLNNHWQEDAGTHQKKDTPHANTGKKPQQDGKREAVTTKSSPKPAGWVTHRWEKNNTKEILALL